VGGIGEMMMKLKGRLKVKATTDLIRKLWQESCSKGVKRVSTMVLVAQ